MEFLGFGSRFKGEYIRLIEFIIIERINAKAFGIFSFSFLLILTEMLLFIGSFCFRENSLKCSGMNLFLFLND